MLNRERTLKLAKRLAKIGVPPSFVSLITLPGDSDGGEMGIGMADDTRGTTTVRLSSRHWMAPESRCGRSAINPDMGEPHAPQWRGGCFWVFRSPFSRFTSPHGDRGG
jgi:hypothetical protein